MKRFNYIFISPPITIATNMYSVGWVETTLREFYENKEAYKYSDLIDWDDIAWRGNHKPTKDKSWDNFCHYLAEFRMDEPDRYEFYLSNPKIQIGHTKKVMEAIKKALKT